MRTAILLIIICYGSLAASGQCYPDRHSTNWFDGWISCSSSPNPNPVHGDGHWILYDFGQVYELGSMHIWNINDPANLGSGIRQAQIDISLDGVEWISAGEYFFNSASGLSTYEGEPGPDLGGVGARYFLVTAVSNWGGDCFGLSEIRIDAVEQVASSIQDPENSCLAVAVSPNPFSESVSVELRSQCPGLISYEITDAFGRVVAEESHLTAGAVRQPALAILPPGVYHLRARQNDVVTSLTLVKVSRE